MEKLKNIPEDPSLKAQAELEQRLIEYELHFDVSSEPNGSFAIEIDDTRSHEAETIFSELNTERMYSGGRLYPWLEDLQFVPAGKENKAVFYYNPE
ncbi:MAG: hypothetical protein RL538_253 [Candidatus Parcubacteria bacterium]